MPRPPLEHLRQHGTDSIYRADQVRVDHSLDRRGHKVAALLVAAADAGVGDHDVDMAEFATKVARGVSQSLSISDVDGEPKRSTSCRCTSRSEIVEHFSSPGHES